MKIKGIITGDIVKSSNLDANQREIILKGLKKVIREISKNIDYPLPFEIIRGDSFQVLVGNPYLSLKAGILIRAGLKHKIFGGQELKYSPDARIGIGIGKIEYRRKNLNESYGEAFRNSGRILEEMKKSGDRMLIKTPLEDVNEELNTECKLADVIVTNWTYEQAEAIFLYWAGETTQSKLAKKLGLSQVAVHKRINLYGKLYAIDYFNGRFMNLIKKCSND